MLPPYKTICVTSLIFLARSVPFGIDPSSGIVTVEWEGEGEGPDWKTSYSLHVAATDGEQEILAPLVIRDEYHTRNYHPLKNRGNLTLQFFILFGSVSRVKSP